MENTRPEELKVALEDEKKDGETSISQKVSKKFGNSLQFIRKMDANISKRMSGGDDTDIDDDKKYDRSRVDFSNFKSYSRYERRKTQ